MIALDLPSSFVRDLGERYGARLVLDAPLARFTAARIGGPADALLEVLTIEELVELVEYCWREAVPYWILGGGSNVLISDLGLRGLVIVNRARQVRFDEAGEPPSVWAESGANLGLVARQAAARGLTGLEWAAGVPGTIGGAVVGNAGAHGADMASSLQMAEILHRLEMSGTLSSKREDWPVEKLEYAYRTSILKRISGQAVVLAASLSLARAEGDEIQAKLNELVEVRRRTQPAGASMGSMFKNPAGDFSGRLIEAAGLKGYRRGNAQISPLHANFFINLGSASATEIYELIDYARQQVADQFGIRLELEVELLGDW